MIFLDTDIISYYFNADAKVREKMLEAINNDESICTTMINVYEIWKGLKWKSNELKEKQFNEFLSDVNVFTIDDEVAYIASNIYADLRKAGKTTGDADILIAAITMKNGGVLVSNNTKHYKNIPQLKLINWL
jgi:predicted nucleic acid-binding protein